MATVVSGLTRPVMNAEVMGVPVGKALVATAAMGVGDVLKAFVAKASGGNLPPWLSGIIVAYALTGVKPIKNFIGADVAELASIVILADTINDQFKVQEATSNFLAGLFGGTVVSKSPPVWTGNKVQSGAPVSSGAGLGV